MSLMSDIATAIKNKFILNDFSSQSNSLLTGGGTISVSATWEVKWSTRFITVSNGRGAALATVGYFDITMPAVSTVITGAGGATNKTVTANGIPLASWETLYYILPLGAPNTTVNANFRVCSYTADINIPNNWIKICSKNDDGGYVDFACGISLRNNTSINTHLYDVKGSDVDGAVSNANTLATARTISASGDIVGTATSFNGSANITIPMTLATIVDSGTGLFKKITTNAKGLITGTTNVVQSDITGLLGSGSITNTMIANTAVSNLSGTNTGDQIITLTGDITGTGTGSFATALSNSGVTAGTYSKMTVDSKGRITAGFTQTMEDIPDATFKRSVKAATTANITLSAPQTIDGVALAAGDRALVKNQTTTSQNGIYVVAAGAWARALDADSASEISSALVAVDTGTINGGKLFDNDFKTTDTLGTTAMVWNANLDDGALLTSGSTSIGIVKYNGTTAAAGQFDGGTTTPTGSTRLNYGGYFYPTYVNLLGTADTATASSHVFVETASDGYVRPKTLANFKTEMFTSPALSGTPTAPTAAVGTNTTQVATTAFVNAEIANDAVPRVTSTDNAIARFDGTTGSVQNSAITIDDSGNIGSGVQSFNGFGGSGFKNYIINGNFDVWQRGTSQESSVDGLNGYGSDDRWVNQYNTTYRKHTRQICTNTERALFNSAYFSRTTTVTAGTSGSMVLKKHHIEDVTKLAGKTVTLSFWAKADATKNIAMEVVQVFGYGGSPSGMLDKQNITTITLTNTWQKKTITFTMPSIIGKTLGTDGVHTSYTQIRLWLDAGSDFSLNTNSLGNQSGIFDISQVQLEEGSVATPFEQRPIGLELSLCQRYYEVSGYLSINLILQSTSWQGGVVSWVFKQTKRTSPTIEFVQNSGTKVAIAQNITANSSLFVPSVQASLVSDYIACIATASAEL